MARRSFIPLSSQYRKKRFWIDTVHAYLYIFPAFLILGTFVLYPFVRAFWVSMFQWWNIRNPKFIGVSNYITVLHDSLFWESLWHTVYYVLGAVAPTMVLALIIAVLLNSKIRGKSFFRTAYFLPYVTNTVAASMVFLWIYDRDYGLLNYILHTLFHVHLIDWLNSPQWAMPAVIILGIWRYLGFDIVIFLAGLQGIDRMYYDAAEVDGATAWDRFRHITLPLLSPTTFFVFIISIIGAFKVFQEIYVLWSGSSGGPLHSAMTIMVYFYNTAWGKIHLGEAAAVANILFIIIFIVTVIQMQLSKRWVFYQ